MIRSFPWSHRISGITLAIALAMPFGPAMAQDDALPDWSHDIDDIVRGPLAWGGLAEEFARCGDLSAAGGNRQSPIVIDSRQASRRLLSPLQFTYADVPLEVENTGHVIEVPYPGIGELRVGTKRYRLVQFHFHTPSEHGLPARRDLEAHFVHRAADGELAVVGVLMRVGPRPRPDVDRILAAAPFERGAGEAGESSINPLSLMPVRFVFGGAEGRRGFMPSYYTYSGSLTTPPCSEGVRWFVAKDVVDVSQAAVVAMQARVARFPTHAGYPFNARPPQAVNGRRIRETIDWH